ncbi:MAG: MBL fold metallo-hydrolase [Bacteroidota bacterium]
MPNKIKKAVRLLLATVIILLVSVWIMVSFFPEPLVSLAISRQIQGIAMQNEENAQILADKESIRIYTIGTASPMPGERVQTGTAIIVNGHFFIFDVGDGVVQKAENMGLPLDRLDGIFITHWHSDHMMDLPSLISRSWLLGRNNELHLYGPDGTDTLNQAINQFLHIENSHRLAHHGPETMDLTKARAIPHEFKNVPNAKEVIYQQDGITITAFDVNHEPIEPAVGYAIEYKGKKVVLSGDTKKNEMVLEMAQDADVLVHEVILNSLIRKMELELKKAGMKRNGKIVHDIQDYHTTPAEVADIAHKAHVKKLVLHHFAPPPDLILIKNIYKQELKGFGGEIHFSNDGDLITVE